MPALKPATPRVTLRKPITQPMLIQSGEEWQVCYQARGALDGRAVTAWVYGPDSTFFCEVGTERRKVNLPDPDAHPFFDDQYNFSIEEVDRFGVRLFRLAGANNITAANAAYQVLAHNAAGIVQMRQGIRIVRINREERSAPWPKDR